MSDQDARAIRQLLQEFVSAWNKGDAEAFANLYTDPPVDVNHTPAEEPGPRPSRPFESDS
jgi:uncharacterized protein (TIGR02246 family)